MKTEKNLKDAFAGESQAFQKYLAFAQRAADEYKDGVYKLFQAIAESERIHAQRHLSYLKGIRDTKENLREALEGEAREFSAMYPGMIADAKEEKQEGAAITFNHANEVEKVHHALFKKALEDPEHYPVMDYFICATCGYIETADAPDRCPVCGADKRVFYNVFGSKYREG